jgi:hypothetical protein
MIFGIKSTILFSVSVSFLIFLFVILSYHYEISDGSFVSRSTDTITPQDFYPNLVSDEKQIFILGSSQVVAINATRIDNYMSTSGYDYNIYNLAQISDTPKQRLATLDMIISSKPEIIVYGIGPRDFESSSTDNVKNLLPDPRDFFTSFLNTHKNLFGFDTSLFTNPQLTTTKPIIIDLINTAEKKSDVIPYDGTPFMKLTTAATIIKNDIPNTGLTYSDHNFSKENIDYISLVEIILKLQENDIDVILFIVPQHKSTLDSYSKDYVELFMLLLDELDETPNLTIHNIFSKYAELNIWADRTHIAINKNTIVYSDDVAKIIMEELKQ